MKVFAATVSVRKREYWIPDVLCSVAIKASSYEMGVKRAMRMARAALPKGTQILEVQVKLAYLNTEKKKKEPALTAPSAS